MSTLADFLKVDGTDYPLAEYFNFLYSAALRAEMTNTETITVTKELTDDDLQFQVITASGADRTVELAPEASSNHITMIYNAGGSNNVVIKDDSGATTFITLLPGDWALCMPILGQTWKIILQTPSRIWTAAFTNVTVNNGVLTSRYSREGSLVHFHVELVWGSTTSMSAGNLTLVLPVTVATYGALSPIGIVRIKDASDGGNAFSGVILSGGQVVVLNASGTNARGDPMTSTSPFTWAVSDELCISGSYFT